MSTNTLIILMIAYFIIFLIGIGFGRGNKITKLEQKLCQLKQLEYCKKEELLKTIK